MMINWTVDIPDELRTIKGYGDYGKRQVAKAVNPHRDNRPMRIWSEFVVDVNARKIHLAVVLSYTKPKHCLSPEDLLYYPKAPATVQRLRFMAPTELLVLAQPINSDPTPVNGCYETIEFERKQLWIESKGMRTYLQDYFSLV